MIRRKAATNILSIAIGCFIGIPVSICAVNHREPAEVYVHYESGLFDQFHEEIVHEVNVLENKMIPDDIEQEMYFDSLDLMACCVEAEAGNQGMIGKKYVADVILNRVDDSDFPDTIADVILQKNAFSVVLDGRINEVSPTEETFQAIKEELAKRTNNEVIFFTSEGFSEYGQDWKQIGDHYFSVKKVKK